jgi:hypothetical protein
VSNITPDISAYVDLRIYDRQPTDLLTRALADAAYKLPGWVPREANTEMVILEGQALEVIEEVYAINRLPGAIMQVVLGAFGIPQLPGAAPQATVTFSVTDTLGHTIPANTNLRLPSTTTGAGDVYFVTTAAAVAQPGSSVTAAVAIVGASNTDVANNVTAGTPIDVLDPLYIVNGCTLASTVTTGALPETGLAYLSRGITALRGLNSTLAIADQFENFALANGAFRAYVEDNYDATVPATAEGVISVAVLGQNGVLLTSGQKTALQIAMNAQAQANLVVRVVDPALTTVNVTGTVMGVLGQDPVALQAAIVTALQLYLSPNTWLFDGTVHYDKLTDIIDNVPGVDYVVGALTTPTTNINLTGFAPLAQAGSMNITVNVP